MESDRGGEFFRAEVLDGLVARIGVTSYSILAIIAAAERNGPPTSNLTIEEIAELVGKSVDATRVAIGVLKEFNLIAVERHGRNNRYIVESATGAAPLNRGL
jgi:DNA-binding transcriptional ArsR family regulator